MKHMLNELVAIEKACDHLMQDKDRQLHEQDHEMQEKKSSKI